MRRTSRLLILGALACAILVPNASATTGDLAFQACQSNATVTGQSCTVQAGLLNAVGNITISPDGKNAYAVVTTSNTVVVFDRNATSGALAIKSGSAGCFANTALSPCTTITPTGALLTPTALSISPDGKNVYVVARGGSLITFDRDTSTGALTEKPVADGCHASAALGGCTVDSTILEKASAVSVSPDGKNVYVAGNVDLGGAGVVTTYSRDVTTGIVTFNSCLANATASTCTVLPDLLNIDALATSILISPDGKDVYLNAKIGNAISAFDRNAATGALTLKAGAAACISNALIPGQSCVVAAGYVDSPRQLALSSDGSTLYAVSGNNATTNRTIVGFTRNAATGALTQSADLGGCFAAVALGSCTVLGALLSSPSGLAVSPDGLNLYVSDSGASVLLAFDRTSAGVLTQKTGAAGCFVSVATGSCSTVSGLLGAVAVVVVSPDGRSLYTGSANDPNISVFARSRPPTLTTVTPARGPTAGGTSVVIAGVNLDGATTVIFGGKTATITANTATSLTVTTPLHIAGTFALIITTADGTQISANAFTFVLPTIKVVLVTAKPTIKIARKSITLRTITTINMAGTIRQVISRMIRGKTRAVCVTTKQVRRAGKFPITCTIGLATRNALKRGQLRLKVITTFSVPGAQAKSTTHRVTLPTIKSVLVTAKPTIRITRRSITLRTITTVNRAGTIRQVISRTIRGKTRAVCVTTKQIRRADKLPITCTIGLATRNAINHGQLRLKVITTFSDTGAQAKSTVQLVTLPTIKIVLVTAKPTIRIARRSITLRTITTVNRAGTIRQMVSRTIRGKARAVCRITKQIRRAGKFPITCTIGLATRNALKRGQLRLKVITTFSDTGAQVKSTAQRGTLARRR